MIFCKVDNKFINSPFKVSDLFENSENREKLKNADDIVSHVFCSDIEGLLGVSVLSV